MKWAFMMALLIGCKDPCVDMCQQVDAWLKKCGSSWEAYNDKNWESVNDCYAAYEDAKESSQAQCERKADRIQNMECY